MVTGPDGVTTGTVGSGFTFIVTVLLATDVPHVLVAVAVYTPATLMLVVVPVPPLLQRNVQPVHGLDMVSVCDWPAQSVTGPDGVTVGVAGPQYVAHSWKVPLYVSPL